MVSLEANVLGALPGWRPLGTLPLGGLPLRRRLRPLQDTRPRVRRVDRSQGSLLRVPGEVTLGTYPLVERAVEYPVGVEVAVVEVVLRVEGSQGAAIRVVLPEHSLPGKPFGPGIRVIFRKSHAQFPCGAAPVSLLPSGLEGRH